MRVSIRRKWSVRLLGKGRGRGGGMVMMREEGGGEGRTELSPSPSGWRRRLERRLLADWLGELKGTPWEAIVGEKRGDSETRRRGAGTLSRIRSSPPSLVPVLDEPRGNSAALSLFESSEQGGVLPFPSLFFFLLTTTKCCFEGSIASHSPTSNHPNLGHPPPPTPPSPRPFNERGGKQKINKKGGKGESERETREGGGLLLHGRGDRRFCGRGDAVDAGVEREGGERRKTRKRVGDKETLNHTRRRLIEETE